jgi:predicted metallopeptidase
MKIDSNSSVQITFYKDKILLSKDSLYTKSGKIDRKELMKANRSTIYNGFLSDATNRKVKRILNSWSKAIEYENKRFEKISLKPNRKLVFITLTLSDKQIHSDKHIKRQMLNRFILKIKKDYGVVNYLWKAEKMNNGRLHIHILIDKFMAMKDIQKEWNKIQKENGYLDNYMNRYNKENPPSTHVRSTNDDKSPEDYMCKYMSKKETEKIENNNKVEGRIWGCSDDLRNLRVYNSGENETVIKELYKLSNEHKIKVIKDEFFEMYIVDTDSFLKRNCKQEFENYVNYYLKLYKNLYHKQMTCQNCEHTLNDDITLMKSINQKWKQLEIKGFERNWVHPE